MFDEKYRAMRIAISHAAMHELMQEGKTIYEVVEILEKGYDAQRKRKKGTIEKWLDKGKKTYNVVIVKDYHEFLREECWVLIHFGKFSNRRM